MSDFRSALGNTIGLEFTIGKNQSGTVEVADLSKINHLLISGCSGSGKSVFFDSLFLTLLLHNPPDILKIVFCDTKLVEFSQYRNVPHLLLPIVPLSKIARCLTWLKEKCIRRLSILSNSGEKNIYQFNIHAWESFKNEMPRIVVVIDDIARAIADVPEIAEQINYILSVGRIVGMHFIAITQTPTEKCMTQITSQFRAKMIFQTTSIADLRSLTEKKNPPMIEAGGIALYRCGDTLRKVHTFMPEAADTIEILDSVCVTESAFSN